MQNPIDIPRLLEDEPYRLSTRRRMQTDLFFLAKWGLGYHKITEQWHQPVADVFVRKTPPGLNEDPYAALERELAEASSFKRRRILLLPRKTYKALALDTRIPTPDGFTTMGTVKVGDAVFSENGKPCKVIGCSPVYESQTCYEIQFSTGEIVIADAGHLWVTDSRRDRDRLKHKGIKHFPCVRSTEELALTVMCRRERNHRIRLAAPLELPDADLPISPYVLGCWLGDGGKEGHSITCAEKEIVDEILKEGETLRYAGLLENDPLKYVFNGGPEHPDYRMRSGKSFASRIRNLELFKNKHIPMVYRRASYHQRLALLQGLMDTDGTTAANGEAIFSNTNLRLSSQVCELAKSLGFKAYLNGPYVARIDGQPKGHFYHVGFKPYSDTQVFRLARKQARLHARKRAKTRQDYRTISAVRKIDSVPVRCIMVDAPSQMFLVTESFIPTHNTTFNIADSVQWVANFPDVAIMTMCASNSPDSPLADAFVAECASHFYCPVGSPQTAFHICFPEHVITKLPKAGEFYTPARTRFRRDPTIKGVSIEQSLSGWHPDIIKSEDVQDNRNSQTAFALKKVRKNFYLNLKMLGETGLLDITGTRYGPMDLYGDMIAKAGEVSIVYWKPAYLR